MGARSLRSEAGRLHTQAAQKRAEAQRLADSASIYSQNGDAEKARINQDRITKLNQEADGFEKQAFDKEKRAQDMEREADQLQAEIERIEMESKQKVSDLQRRQQDLREDSTSLFF